MTDFLDCKVLFVAFFIFEIAVLGFVDGGFWGLPSGELIVLATGRLARIAAHASQWLLTRPSIPRMHRQAEANPGQPQRFPCFCMGSA